MLGIALAGCGTGSPGASSPPSPPATNKVVVPSPTRTTTPTVADSTAAAAIIAGPDARIDSMAVIPGHPDRRIAEWYTCPDPHCYRRTYALVVSDDGFRTRHLVDVPTSRVANGWVVEPAGADHLAISPNGGRRRLVDLSGHVTRITVAGDRGPLVGTEVPLRDTKAGFLAVDPDTGRAHPLSTPPNVVEVYAAPSGQLRALTYEPAHYSWSADGGRTWHEIPIPPGNTHLVADYVPTPSDTLHVLVLGGENTVFPWDTVLRSTDGRTWSTYDGPTDPTGYIDDGAVLPDGRLVLDVGGWSDQLGSHPSVNPPGFWAGSDWAHLRPVPPRGPFAGQEARLSEPRVIDTVATPRTMTLYALTPDQTGVVSTSDGGATWRPEPAR